MTRTSVERPSTPGPDDSRFLPGAVIADRYRIFGLIGRGGMGEVYRAGSEARFVGPWVRLAAT